MSRRVGWVAALLAATCLLAASVEASNVTFQRDISADTDGDPAVIPPEIRASIRKGQEYLRRAQRKDGSIGGGTAQTALATLAFMVDGSTPGYGPYGKEVAKGMKFLLSIARPTGLILSKNPKGGPMYHHALATLCLAEIWGMTGNPEVRPVLKRAVDLIVRCQTREGGWRYHPRPEQHDLSVTVMQIVAVRAAENAGIAVPGNVIKDAIRYVKRCHEPKSGGFNYQPGKKKAEVARTAAGVISLQLCGQFEAKETQAALGYIWGHRNRLHKLGKHCFYTHYYAMQAMYQARDNAKWNEWYLKSCKGLMRKQRRDGGFASGHGTGMAILAMGLPYRYLPIYQR